MYHRLKSFTYSVINLRLEENILSWSFLIRFQLRFKCSSNSQSLILLVIFAILFASLKIYQNIYKFAHKKQITSSINLITLKTILLKLKKA